MNLNKSVKTMLSKITIVTVLSSAVYMGLGLEESYAFENQNQSINLQAKNGLEVGRVRPCDFLNIRTGPSVNNSIIASAHTGNWVHILEKYSNGWYKIRTSNNTEGWVNGNYIEIQRNDNVDEGITDSRIQNIVNLAHQQIGKTYRWGASGPDSFDCSGFTSYVYKNAANINLPRVSREQATVGTTISKNDLKAGDLVFFSSNGRTITHVGLYIGNSNMIHAPSSGKNVKIDNINSSYYTRTYVTAKRII